MTDALVSDMVLMDVDWMTVLTETIPVYQESCELAIGCAMRNGVNPRTVLRSRAQILLENIRLSAASRDNEPAALERLGDTYRHTTRYICDLPPSGAAHGRPVGPGWHTDQAAA